MGKTNALIKKMHGKCLMDHFSPVTPWWSSTIEVKKAQRESVSEGMDQILDGINPEDHGPFVDIRKKARDYTAYSSLYLMFCKCGAVVDQYGVSGRGGAEARMAETFYSQLKLLEQENKQSKEIKTASKHLRTSYPRLFEYLNRDKSK